MTDNDKFLIEHFGMTADAIRRVMKHHKEIVCSEARDVIAHADFYMNPTDYVIPEDLPDEWDEQGINDDGYPNLYEYKENDEAIFMHLIGMGTPYGGYGSACDAVSSVKEEQRESDS